MPVFRLGNKRVILNGVRLLTVVELGQFVTVTGTCGLEL
jgi:hypothetical protein